ncbi:hypothetical protein V8C86DRAFT_2631050 [Haematococcus lacustris]
MLLLGCAGTWALGGVADLAHTALTALLSNAWAQPHLVALYLLQLGALVGHWQQVAGDRLWARGLAYQRRHSLASLLGPTHTQMLPCL